MEEVKKRHEVISLAASGQLSSFIPPVVAWELCHLQLRMICELFALGSLLAHGDIKDTQTKRLRTAYQADWIVGQIERIHPNFYPRPSKVVRDKSGADTVEPITSGYLTKSDLLALYHECGGVLHRGNFQKLFGQPHKQQLDFKRVAAWTDKIVTLLNHHQIAFIDPTRELWVTMQTEDGRAQAAIMEEMVGESR